MDHLVQYFYFMTNSRRVKSPSFSSFKTNQGKASSSHLYVITWYFRDLSHKTKIYQHPDVSEYENTQTKYTILQ